MTIVLSAPQELDQVFDHFQHLQPEISTIKKELAKNIFSQKSYDKNKNHFGHEITKNHFGSFDAHIQRSYNIRKPNEEISISSFCSIASGTS